MKTTILFIAAILLLTGCRNPSAPETDNTTESENDLMSTWQTPKTDWKAGDRPVSADANRWESNVDYLCPVFISGSVTRDDMVIFDNSEEDVFRHFFYLPPGKRLVFRMVNYHLSPSPLNLKFWITKYIPDGTIYNYQSESNRGEEHVDIDTGFTNGSTAPLELRLYIMIRNNSSSNVTVDQGSSWQLRLTFVDID